MPDETTLKKSTAQPSDPDLPEIEDEKDNTDVLWPLLALPGTYWLVFLFLVPFYGVMAVAFSDPDRLTLITQQPIPEWNPLNWNFSTFTDVIAKAGYGEFFVHRTGHGMGLEGHEPPYITATSETILEEGMVFSIEPGIYLPGRFGIRLEDIVILRKDGPEILSSLPRTVQHVAV